MKLKVLIPAVAMAMTLGAGFTTPVFAQKMNMDNVKAMDTDKDGMVSKAEFLRKMEAMFDQMDKGRKGRLTPEEAGQLFRDIASFYGTAP
jgi:hypothetical protein